MRAQPSVVRTILATLRDRQPHALREDGSWRWVDKFGIERSVSPASDLR